MTEWFPIETLPQDGTQVLIAGKLAERHGHNVWLYEHTRCFDGAYFTSLFGNKKAELITPTHWTYFNLPNELSRK